MHHLQQQMTVFRIHILITSWANYSRIATSGIVSVSASTCREMQLEIIVVREISVVLWRRRGLQ